MAFIERRDARESQRIRIDDERMIEVDHLVKRYGDYTAVHDVSFRAQKGDVVGFLGPNGAGKTTSIRMLVTYLPATSGTARIAGFDVATDADEVRRRIGYLPETPPLYGEMRVREYLKFVARIKGVRSRDVRSSVDEAMARCFIDNVADKLCQHLSRGYRQRVGLAQAIIHKPEVIILDEPTSGLDPKQIVQIRQMIKSLAENHTVVLSTHILPEVTMVCTKVVIVNRGRSVLEGSVADVTANRSLEQVFMECVSAEETDGLAGGAK